MKHSTKHLLALLIVFGATVVKAADPSSVAAVCEVVASEEVKHYRVVYKAPGKSNVTIQLYNDEQEVIYKESQVSVSGFMRKFDLSHLPDGEYQLEVKSEGYLFQEKIKLGSSASDYNVVFTPYSSREIVFVAQNELGDGLNLYILDEQGEVVYKEVFENASQIQKMFNFKNLKSDKVTFVLYHNDQLIKEKEIRF